MKYKAHDYQAYATNFILEHPISAVFLDMGLGKSIITLSAIFDLCLDSFLVRKVLVIAPLRVARDTWPAEIHKWDHLHGLTYSVAVGTEAERKAALRQRVSVYIMKQYDKGSEWGIDGGRISKLMFKRNGYIVCNYDRGWDIEPADENTQLALELLLHSENW